jgi:hypothetical protein
MMAATSLSSLETLLREAVASRNYAEVQRLVVLLGAATAEQVSSLSAGDPLILEIGGWLDDLLDWTRTMLRVSRAAQADELRRIPFVRSYLKQQNL